MRSFEEAFDALKGLTNYETMVRPPYGKREMNLPRTRALLRAVGSPERAYSTIQVAGTKGKGTTSTALAAMLRAAGHRVGLFTSPHLFDLRERIRVDGRWIGKGEFVRGVRTLLEVVTPLAGTVRCPTFFELMTCLALHHFREAGVTAAVLEVGLGGRLDATSAVRPALSIITQIGLDHTAILGRTKALIAAEKAGVAKRGVPLLSGVPGASAAGRVIAREARRKGARLLLAGRDFRVRTGRPRFSAGRPATSLTVSLREGPVLRGEVPLLGRELARGAGLAAAALLSLKHPLGVGPEAARRGLLEIAVPGRIQVAGERPFLVVDGAHNPDSARSLVTTIREALPYRRALVVLGGGKDKGMRELYAILRALGPRPRFLFTKPATHPRAAEPRDFGASPRGDRVFPTLAGALGRARELAGEPDLILVTGSLYLAGEALGLLNLNPCGRGSPEPARSPDRRSAPD